MLRSTVKSLLISLSLYMLIFLSGATALYSQQPDIVWQTNFSTTAVTHLQFSPDGSRLAVKFAGQDSVVYILNSTDGSTTAVCMLPEGDMKQADFTLSPDGAYLYIVSRADLSAPFYTQFRLYKWSVEKQVYTTTLSFSAPHDPAHPGSHEYFTSVHVVAFPGTDKLGVIINNQNYGPWTSSVGGRLYFVSTTADTVTGWWSTGRISKFIPRNGILSAYAYETHTSISSPWEQRSDTYEGLGIGNITANTNERLPMTRTTPIVFTPDNNYLAINQNDSVQLWDYRRNIFPRSLPSFLAQKTWSFLTDLHYLFVFRAQNDTAGIYNIKDNSWEHFFVLPDADQIAFHPNPRLFATATSRGEITLWRITDTLSSVPLQADFSVADTLARIDQSVTFSNSSFPIHEETKFHWDFGDGTTSTEFQPAHIYTSPGRYTVQLVVVNPDGNSDTLIKQEHIYIPSLSEDIVWREKTNQRFTTDLNYSSDGTYIFALTGPRSSTCKAKAFDAATGLHIVIPSIDTSQIEVAASLSEGSIATAIADTYGSVQYSIYTLPDGNKTKVYSYIDSLVEWVLMQEAGWQQVVGYDTRLTLTSSPDCRYLATGIHNNFSMEQRIDRGRDTSIFYWPTLFISRTDAAAIVFKAAIPVYSADFTSDGNSIAIAEGDSITFRKTETGKIINSIKVRCTGTVQCSPTNADIIAFPGGLWNTQTGVVTDIPTSAATDFAFTPDGRYIIAVFADEDSAAAIFDIGAHAYVFWYISHPSRQICMDIAPDGKHFASGAEDGSVTVWNIPSGFWPDTTATSIAETNLPIQLSLEVHPNPANAEGCTLVASLREPSQVELVITDIYGRRVATAFRGMLQAGRHPVQWNAQTAEGTTVAPGVYYCTVWAEGRKMSVQIVIAK